ncbi:MAG: nitronate monooxygenase [Thermoleophilia bacterium]|nr:nitronate monooxygenase [Thermoleophilia bacterium]
MPQPHIPTVVLAPMAGGPSTVELAAAVSDAGGLGYLASGYLRAAAMSDRIEELRALTARPFGVNLFLVARTPVDASALDAYVASLERDAQLVGAEVGEARFDDDDLAAKVEVLLRAPVAVVSFAFGCPAAETVRALQAVGTQVWVTVTSVEEAEVAAATGCDALVAQGAEAGGHRSSFTDDGGEGALGVLALVRAVVAAVDLPVVAAGGVATAGDVGAALEAGAVAVQCGTAFLRTDECGAHPVHRAAVASNAPTDWTRAFSGRTARGIVNAFMRDHPDAPVAYPQVHHATAPIRAAARAAGDGDRVNLWAGTRHELAQPGPAADVVRALGGH